MPQRKLKLMISSRSDSFSIPNGQGGETSLRDVRVDLKARIENEAFFDGGLVEVWINETEHGSQTETDWDECLKVAAECDLFISLYDGDPGWTGRNKTLGICQAEFDAAFNTAPQKVQVVRLPKAKLRSPATVAATNYLGALTRAARFETRIEKDWPELIEKIGSLVRQMILRAALEGARDFRKSGHNVGQALAWNRMDFGARSSVIRDTIAGAVAPSPEDQFGQGRARRRIEEHNVLFVSHGAPRSMSESAGREAVGKPFFEDHRLVDLANNERSIGPVHLIGCPKGVTDLQAITLLGTSDITVVGGSFGVYAADRVNMVQVCLLADCADSGSTRNAVVRLFEWLERSGEQADLIKRAMSRKKILDVVSSEISA